MNIALIQLGAGDGTYVFLVTVCSSSAMECFEVVMHDTEICEMSTKKAIGQLWLGGDALDFSM